MQNIDTSALAAAKAKLDAAEAQREEVLLRHIANGVDIRSRNVEIGSEVVIAPGAVILAGTILRGKTAIGAGCVIGPNTLIEDSTVDEDTTVNASQVYSSHLGPHNNIGPFTHVRIAIPNPPDNSLGCSSRKTSTPDLHVCCRSSVSGVRTTIISSFFVS